MHGKVRKWTKNMREDSYLKYGWMLLINKKKTNNFTKPSKENHQMDHKWGYLVKRTLCIIMINLHPYLKNKVH